VTVAIVDGRITDISAVRNPHKLGGLAAPVDLGRS